MAKNIELFKVTDIVPRTDITTGGEIVEKREIFFETKSGVSDSVIVPKEMSEEDAREQVRKEAEKIEGLMETRE